MSSIYFTCFCFFCLPVLFCFFGFNWVLYMVPFSRLSYHTNYTSLKIFYGCPRVWNIYLQLLEVCFQTTIYGSQCLPCTPVPTAFPVPALLPSLFPGTCVKPFTWPCLPRQRSPSRAREANRPQRSSQNSCYRPHSRKRVRTVWYESCPPYCHYWGPARCQAQS